MDVFDLYAKISIDLSEFEQGLNQAKTKVESFAKNISSLSSDINKAYSGIGDLLAPAVDGFKAVEGVGMTAGNAVMTGLKGFAAASTAVAGFGTAAVKTGATFDSSMSQVVATMGFSVEELNDKTSDAYEIYQKLRNAAIDSGATTVFSATESADALNYMALAGYDAETSMAMLPKVLNLAASGSIDLATASDMITDSQTALGLTLDETSIMIDQMAKASTKSNTSVAELGDAILTVGGTAKYMAGGTAEINTVLGALADASIKGSEGGTKLRNMILSLSAPTDKGAAVIEQLGLNVFDADGKMRSFSEIFPELNASLSELTDQQKIDALSTIFNNRDIAAVEALLGTTTERWEELGGAILDAEGAAEKMAAVQLDNLQGDVTLLQSAFEGLQIVISDALTPTMREFAQFGSNAMDELRKGFQGDGVTGFMSALTGIVTDGVKMLAEKAPEFASVSLQFIQALADGILGARSEIAIAASRTFSLLIDGIGSWLSTNSGELIGAGNQIIAVIFSAFLEAGSLISDNIGQFIPLIARAFIDYHDALFLVGIDILGAIGQGIIDNKEGIQSMASTAIMEMAVALQDNAPMIIEGGIALLEALVGAIEENMPLILETGATIIGQLIEGITTASPGVQAVIATAVLPHILKIVETVGSIGGAVGDVVKLVGDGIGTVMDIGGLLMTGIQNLFGLIMANPVVAVIGIAIGAIILLWTKCEWFRDGVKAVLEAIGGFFSAAWELIQGIWNGAVEFFGGIIDGIKGVFDGIGEFLGGLFTAAWEAVKTAWNAAAEFFVGIWEGIQGVFSTVVEVLGGFFSAAWEAIQAVWNIAKEFFSGIADGIHTAFEAVTSFLGDAFSAAWDIISGIWDAAVDFFSNIWDGITGVFDAVAEWFGNIFSQAWDAVCSAWDSVTDFFAGIWEDITGVFANVWDKFKEIGGNMLKGLWEGVTGAFGWLGEKIGGVVDGIIGFFTDGLDIHSPSKVFEDIGVNVMLGLADGIEGEDGTISAQTEEIVQTMLDAFAGMSSIFGEIGQNAMSALGGSLGNAIASLQSKVAGLMTGIANAAKAALQIHSPSRVFAGIGENMALGLAEGWEDEYSDIKRQITNSLDFGTASVGLVTNGTCSASELAQNGPQTGFGGAGGTTVNIYSPVAIDAVTAAREWKKTTQRMAMGYV